MGLATVDRVEGEVLVLVTHTEPRREIHLTWDLFEGLNEGDVVRVRLEKDEKGKEGVEREIREIRKGLKRVKLHSIGT